MKLQFKNNQWEGGNVPDKEHYYNDKGYEWDLELFLSQFKPIAPKDQEKVNKFAWKHLPMPIDPGKLYDSGDLEFKSEFICPNGHSMNYQTVCVYPHCHKSNQQFWVLKEKAKEVKQLSDYRTVTDKVQVEEKQNLMEYIHQANAKIIEQQSEIK